MNKLVYFYLLLSLPCFICVLWDTQRAIFAMDEGKTEEPLKTEIEAEQTKEKQLLQEKLFLEEEYLEQEKQQAPQTQTKLPAGDSQKTPPSSDTTNIIETEKTEEKEIEKTEQEIEDLNKELATEFETTEQPSKKPSTPEPSPITICIGSLIMQNITKAQNIFADKNNKDSFTQLTNELDSTIGQLMKYESDKIGPSYYTMSTNDIQARRNKTLKTDPKDKDYDKVYAQLVNQEELIRGKVRELLQEKTGAEIDLINSIIEGCANKRFINILVKGKEASESILSED